MVPTVDIKESSVIGFWRAEQSHSSRVNMASRIEERWGRDEKKQEVDQEPRAGHQEESREEPRQHVAKMTGFLRKLG